MGLNVDQQFFDLFTAIDNLMKQNNQLQQQNNALLQQNNALLGAILEKPAILEAPRLTELTIEQKSISIPENLDVAPQFFIDEDARRFYVMVETFYVSGWHDLAPNTTYDSGHFKPSDAIKFDLIRLIDFKYVGFNMIEATNKPANVRVGFDKNRKAVFNFFILPENSEREVPDRSDVNYNFESTDSFREIVINYSVSLDVRVYKEWHFAVYREIGIEVAIDYVNFLKKIVS